MSGYADLLKPVGPQAEAFVKDKRLLTAIMGPPGSAKSTSCIRKIVFESPLWQVPGPDGVIRVRWAAVRATYPQLERNVLKSWFMWFPKNRGNWNGSTLTHTLRYELVDAGTGKVHPVELEMIFIALNDKSAEDVLPGLELTGLWLNEVNTLPIAVWLIGAGRTGRYPSSKFGGCTWSGVICDMNAPDIDSWTYDLLVERNLGLDEETEAELREALGERFGVGFYRQPGWRSKDPPPENLENVEPGYAAKLMMVYAKNPNLFRRLVDNEFGMVVSGQLVFPEINQRFHFTDEALKPLPDWPIFAGLDGGRTPAMVFFQVPNGNQCRVLDELVIYDPSKASADDSISLERLGPKAFGELARNFCADRYGEREIECVFYDPSIDFGQEEDAYHWLEVFRDEFPSRYKPGGDAGNRLQPRHDAVRDYLNTSPGGQPGMLISSACPVLRRGFSGGYILEEAKTSTGKILKDRPKGPFTHVQDGLQHGVLGFKLRGRGMNAMRERREAQRFSPTKVTYSKQVAQLRGQRGTR